MLNLYNAVGGFVILSRSPEQGRKSSEESGNFKL